MAKHDFLTKERELELGAIIQKGASAKEHAKTVDLESPEGLDIRRQILAAEEAIDELVKANIGLVWDRAKAFKAKFPGSPDLEDLVQEGMTGLMTAVHKYDPKRGNKFSTVAYYWITQAIGRGVNKTARLVRLPENRIGDYSKMAAIAAKYEDAGLTMSELDDKIKDELGLSQVQINNIRNAGGTHASLNRRVGGDGEGRELMDIVGESNPVYGAEYAVTNRDCFDILGASIQQLGDLKMQVVASHFALSVNGVILNPADVREVNDLSTSKYRRILAEGLEELKTELKRRDLDMVDFL